MTGRSRVAFALAVGAAVAVVLLALSVLWAVADKTQGLTAESVSLVSAVLGGVVGALATYLGQDAAPRPPAPPAPPIDPDPGPPDDLIEP